MFDALRATRTVRVTETRHSISIILETISTKYIAREEIFEETLDRITIKNLYRATFL
jgi:hypothetical protein